MDQDLPRGNTRFVLAVLSRDGAFTTAHELHRRVHLLGRPMGISTVYRVLRYLMKRDLIDMIVGEDKQRWYRHCSTRPHHHLVCSGCHATVEIPIHSSPLLAWTPDEALGFTDVVTRVTVTGICSACAQPSSRCG